MWLKNQQRILKMIRPFQKLRAKLCHLIARKFNVIGRIHWKLNNLYNALEVIVPIIWPRGNSNILVQLSLLASLGTIIIGSSVNVAIPLYSKKIVDTLSSAVGENNEFCRNPSILSTKTTNMRISSLDNSHSVPMNALVILVILKLFQGIGALSLLRCSQIYLGIFIDNFVRRQIKSKFLEHVHSLSVSWHTNKRASQILATLEAGTESVVTILNHLIGSLIPTVVDLLIATIYLSSTFGWWFGLCLTLQILIYLSVTIQMSESGSDLQRPFNSAKHDQNHIILESLCQFETVKYFGNSHYETCKLNVKIDKLQKLDFKCVTSSLWLMMIQLLIFNSGLLLASISVMKIILDRDEHSIGDYVLFTAYLTQLYSPLNYLGTYYRTFRMNVVDVEAMLEILKEKPENFNGFCLNSKFSQLNVTRGEVEFRNVNFGYDVDRPILHDISFTIPHGKTVALVGFSGSGKTSILRLLFGFYNVNSGEILIDGQNISSVTRESLREAMGVVPQNGTLFNDTLKRNITYAKLDALDSEVCEVTAAASLQQTIIGFGYDTVVGEGGLKLSGGEKQRVIIARTLLKNPPIILFDEATSSLDVQTERQVGSAIRNLCRNRTCLMVTHRLSTIVHAHEILVLKHGVIVERGRHDQLISQKGDYWNLWMSSSNDQQQGHVKPPNGF